MNLEELKALLEGNKLGNAYEAVLELVELEKQKGIRETGKKHREVQSLSKYKQALEALGLQDDDDPDEFTASLIKKSSNKDESLTMKTLKSELDSMKRERDAEKAKALDYQRKAKAKSISSELMKELGSKVYGPDLLIKDLINTGVVDTDENDHVIFKIDDQTLPLSDGIKKVLEQRQDIIKNNQQSGAGTHGSNSIPSNTAQVMKSGSKEQVIESLPEIKKAMGLVK